MPYSYCIATKFWDTMAPPDIPGEGFAVHVSRALPLLLLLSAAAYGQADKGSFVGTIVDSSGAPVANAAGTRDGNEHHHRPIDGHQ